MMNVLNAGQHMDLKKYKAWTPSSGQSSNLEYTNSITKFVRNYKSSEWWIF